MFCLQIGHRQCAKLSAEIAINGDPRLFGTREFGSVLVIVAAQESANRWDARRVEDMARIADDAPPLDLLKLNDREPQVRVFEASTAGLMSYSVGPGDIQIRRSTTRLDPMPRAAVEGVLTSWRNGLTFPLARRLRRARCGSVASLVRPRVPQPEPVGGWSPRRRAST